MKSRKSKSKVGKPKSKATSTVEHIVEKQPQPEQHQHTIELPHCPMRPFHKGKGWYSLFEIQNDKSKEGYHLVREIQTGLRARDLIDNRIQVPNITIHNQKPQLATLLYKRNLDCVLYDGRVQCDRGLPFVKVFVAWPKGTPYRATLERLKIQSESEMK